MPSSYVWPSEQKPNMFIMKLISYYWLNLSTYCQLCNFTVDEMVPTEGNDDGNLILLPLSV